MSDALLDLLVIGGGPGGYVAAIRGAQLGLSTAVVEREHLGGICLNWGCIPTKALLHTASVYRQIQHAGTLGIEVQGVSFDFGKLIQRSRAVADRMNKGVRFLLKKNKVALHEGEGRIVGPDLVEVSAAGGSKTLLRAKHIVVATGARARDIPNVVVDGDKIWNYRHALAPRALPASLLVVGAGAIGMEFASFYSALGTRVTVAELQDRVLPTEDEDVSAFVSAAFTTQGISIRTGTAVSSVERAGDVLRVSLKSGDKSDMLEVSHVLIAVGVTGNVEGCGLEGTAVKVEKGHVVVDERCATAQPGIYAIGDVAGPPMLAHKASHEGVACVEHIAGVRQGRAVEPKRIPACTYSHPQVASVGLTEAQVRAAGYEPRVGRFPFTGNGKAVALGEPEGFVKTVFDRETGELLGAHMVGPEVTELIHGFSVAKTLEATEAELIETVYPHPTLSEAAHESVLAAFGRSIHV